MYGTTRVKYRFCIGATSYILKLKGFIACLWGYPLFLHFCSISQKSASFSSSTREINCTVPGNAILMFPLRTLRSVANILKAYHILRGGLLVVSRLSSFSSFLPIVSLFLVSHYKNLSQASPSSSRTTSISLSLDFPSKII